MKCLIIDKLFQIDKKKSLCRKEIDPVLVINLKNLNSIIKADKARNQALYEQDQTSSIYFEAQYTTTRMEKLLHHLSLFN